MHSTLYEPFTGAVHRFCGSTGLNSCFRNDATVAGAISGTQYMSSIQALGLAMIGCNYHVGVQLGLGLRMA